MRSTTGSAVASLILALLVSGCSKESASASDAAPSASGAALTPSAAPVPSVSATAPSASASAVVVPHDCPKGSTGDGSFEKPCVAKGGARMMEATWIGKSDDKGPQFRVINKSPLVILYGKIAVYFYDKAGKQLDVQDTSATPPKSVPYRTCFGNIFGGVMKPGEKAVMSFSCVKKEHVPEGTAAIEAELQTVGFADPTEKKVDFYWTNKDLIPEARKKGGVK